MKNGRKTHTKGVKELRKTLLDVVDAAAQGQVTIITRHGRAVAAVVPAGRALKPTSLLTVAGTGKGLWGRNPTSAIARFRDEWKSEMEQRLRNRVP